MWHSKESNSVQLSPILNVAKQNRQPRFSVDKAHRSIHARKLHCYARTLLYNSIQCCYSGTVHYWQRIIPNQSRRPSSIRYTTPLDIESLLVPCWNQARRAFSRDSIPKVFGCVRAAATWQLASQHPQPRRLHQVATPRWVSEKGSC